MHRISIYFLIRTQLEWQPTKSDNKDLYGSFNQQRQKNFCTTPGLSRGLAIGDVTVKLPSYAHNKLVKNVRSHSKCGLKNRKHCLRFVSIPTSNAAIRARTITSVGMDHINVNLAIIQEKSGEVYWDQDTNSKSQQVSIDVMQMQDPWKRLMEDFVIDLKSISTANRYLLVNAKNIAEDNLKGQCTRGHSCKDSAKYLLRKVIQKVQKP